MVVDRCDVRRKDDAFGNPKIDRLILKKGRHTALQRPSKVLRQRVDFHDPLLLFLPANCERSHRDNIPHRAEDDLPPVGVCVAGATPPVDKSTTLYLSCSKNKRSPARERKPVPTQIERIPHNLSHAIPRQSRLDTPDRVCDFRVTLHAAYVFNHVARRKGNCDGFQLQSPRSSRRRNPASGLLPARRVRKDHRLSTRAARFQLAASCPSR